MSKSAPVPATGRLEALARRLLALVGRATGLESTYVTAIHWEEGVQEILYARNVGALDIPEGLDVAWDDTLCRRALESGRQVTDDVPTCFPGSAAAEALGLRTYVTVPLTDGAGGIFGTLCGASSRSIEVDADGIELLTTLAEMLSLQLAHDHATQQLVAQAAELAAANAALELLAVTDPLTGLWSRRLLQPELARQASRARRRDESFAVVADEALVAVAQHLRLATRDDDAVLRLGGDEFLVILAGADAHQAALVGERIRASIAAHPLPTARGPVTVTTSIGVASSDGTDVHDLLQRADAALYRAKVAGRDAVAR